MGAVRIYHQHMTEKRIGLYQWPGSLPEENCTMRSAQPGPFGSAFFPPAIVGMYRIFLYS
jgi:hypothetical protein